MINCDILSRRTTRIVFCNADFRSFDFERCWFIYSACFNICKIEILSVTNSKIIDSNKLYWVNKSKKTTFQKTPIVDLNINEQRTWTFSWSNCCHVNSDWYRKFYRVVFDDDAQSSHMINSCWRHHQIAINVESFFANDAVKKQLINTSWNINLIKFENTCKTILN